MLAGLCGHSCNSSPHKSQCQVGNGSPGFGAQLTLQGEALLHPIPGLMLCQLVRHRFGGAFAWGIGPAQLISPLLSF